MGSEMCIRDSCLPVPDPSVVKVISDFESSIIVGSFTVLTCTVELSPAVDVPVTVSTVWTGPDGFMTANVAQPVMGSTTTYNSTAMVSSFGRDQSGVYTCTATVSSTSQYLTGSSSHSGSATIVASEMLQLIVVLLHITYHTCTQLTLLLSGCKLLRQVSLPQWRSAGWVLLLLEEMLLSLAIGSSMAVERIYQCLPLSHILALI